MHDIEEFVNMSYVQGGNTYFTPYPNSLYATFVYEKLTLQYLLTQPGVYRVIFSARERRIKSSNCFHAKYNKHDFKYNLQFLYQLPLTFIFISDPDFRLQIKPYYGSSTRAPETAQGIQSTLSMILLLDGSSKPSFYIEGIQYLLKCKLKCAKYNEKYVIIPYMYFSELFFLQSEVAGHLIGIRKLRAHGVWSNQSFR